MKKILFILLFTFALNGQGIILETTSEIIEVLTTSTADLDYQINWVDVVVATGATPGASEGKITTATTTTVLAAPLSSTYRVVKGLSIKNVHASTSNIVTFKKDISATEYQLTGATTLLAGESLIYTDVDGWQKMTSGGVKQYASVSFQVNVQTFAADGNWNKPTDFTPKVVKVKLWGGGGGGGAGASLCALPHLHRGRGLRRVPGPGARCDAAVRGGDAGGPGGAGAHRGVSRAIFCAHGAS